MIYLHRYARDDRDDLSVEIAVVEDDDKKAARYEALGYTRCTLGGFRAAWRLKVARGLRLVMEEQLREKAVGNG